MGRRAKSLMGQGAKGPSGTTIFVAPARPATCANHKGTRAAGSRPCACSTSLRPDDWPRHQRGANPGARYPANPRDLNDPGSQQANLTGLRV